MTIRYYHSNPTSKPNKRSLFFVFCSTQRKAPYVLGWLIWVRDATGLSTDNVALARALDDLKKTVGDVCP